MPIASRFRHSITIHRWTAGVSTTPRGNRADTWVPDEDPIRGWIQPRTSREIETDEHTGVAISDALGFLPITATVTARDRLEESSRIFAIVGPPRDAAGRGKHLELDLRQVTP
jgi:head-tail adaptor